MDIRRCFYLPATWRDYSQWLEDEYGKASLRFDRDHFILDGKPKGARVESNDSVVAISCYALQSLYLYPQAVQGGINVTAELVDNEPNDLGTRWLHEFVNECILQFGGRVGNPGRWRWITEYVDLRPNIFGLGLNLNELIDRFLLKSKNKQT